jgi:3',5'-cyclic AMP phosphodiesterase CpdA
MSRTLPYSAALLLVGCLKFTPFKDEPDESRLTAHALARLAEQSPPGRWSFLAFGDTHDEYDDLERSVAAMNQTSARLALIAGDLSDRGTLQEFEWSGELYRKLTMPFVTVIGNHDEISDGLRIYERMYGPRNYSFHYGGLFFVLFDSNTLENAAAPDRDWIDQQIRDRGDDKVVLVTHQSVTDPNDVEGGEAKQYYDDLLSSGDVALVVHGHLDEYYLRLVHDVPVLQCGTYETQRTHTLIDFDGEKFGFQRCQFDDCEAVEPEAP